MFRLIEIAIDAAKVAVDVVKEAVKAALELAATLVANSFTKILSIPRMEFDLVVKGFTPREFGASIELVLFQSARVRLSVYINFSDIFRSYVTAATNTSQPHTRTRTHAHTHTHL